MYGKISRMGTKRGYPRLITIHREVHWDFEASSNRPFARRAKEERRDFYDKT